MTTTVIVCHTLLISTPPVDTGQVSVPGYPGRGWRCDVASQVDISGDTLGVGRETERNRMTERERKKERITEREGGGAISVLICFAPCLSCGQQHLEPQVKSAKE